MPGHPWNAQASNDCDTGEERDFEYPGSQVLGIPNHNPVQGFNEEEVKTEIVDTGGQKADPYSPQCCRKECKGEKDKSRIQEADLLAKVSDGHGKNRRAGYFRTGTESGIKRRRQIHLRMRQCSVELPATLRCRSQWSLTVLEAWGGAMRVAECARNLFRLVLV